MRGVTAVLVLLLASCSTAGEDTTTTTTAPLAEPSTTTTTVSSTTTTTEPTTTTEDECVDRDGDGVLRNRRGFVCPPTMHTYTGTGIVVQDLPQQYLPGTFFSRAIDPPVKFRRVERFTSIGETPGFAVNLDVELADGKFIDLFDTAPSAGLVAAPLGDLEWVSRLSITDDAIGGVAATVVDFAIPEDAPCSVSCTLDIGAGQLWEWGYPLDVRLVIFNHDGRPSVFHVQAHPDDFDEYWTEVAEPILDSIEFLDP